MPPAVVIGLEPWGSAGLDEMQELARAHMAEVGDLADPRRPAKLNDLLMGNLSRSGLLRIITARVDGLLLGYLLWTIMPDVESQGLLIADMGPWYVAPDAPNTVALRLWRRGLTELRLAGVSLAHPHNRLAGRGARLGKLFARLGGQPEKQTWSLWLEDRLHG